ncbi:GerAB/ArcD/ProY family transporter [Alkalihalophilus marmarensis]|uniref:GerAB/ArcD/ProY family transporter n=1 Tax=Alkalihalophilus marmarensis TaxID=521377 RepID=UPI00399CF878
MLSAKAATLSLLGFEIFIILFATTEGSIKTKVKAATIANVTVTLIYAYLAFTCYIFFSPEEIDLVPEPILYLIKSFSFIVLERTDLIFLTVWMVSVLTSFVGYLYIASLGQLFYLIKPITVRLCGVFVLLHSRSAFPPTMCYV